MGSISPELEQGRTAYERRSWQAAWEALEAARQAAPLEPPDLWRLAVASLLVGREDGYTRALQEAHQTHLDRGEPVAAARNAFWLGFYLSARAELARATGWFGRAARLLEGWTGNTPNTGTCCYRRATSSWRRGTM